MQSENPRVEFTETQIEKLVEIYTDAIEHRRTEIESKYLEKGNVREEDSITLLSLNENKMYIKNAERRSNGFITGEWDLHEQNDKGVITITLDTKSSWSRVTFNKARVKKLNHNYKYQGHGYMWLTGALQHVLAYCLVNGTAQAISDEIRRLSWKMGVLDADVTTDIRFIEKAKQVEINHIFDIDAFVNENPGHTLYNDVHFNYKINKWEWPYDIPAKERIFKEIINRDEAEIIKIQNRIIKCRQKLIELFA